MNAAISLSLTQRAYRCLKSLCLLSGANIGEIGIVNLTMRACHKSDPAA